MEISGSARITEAIRAWRRRLLDLSRRNRLLNFKPTKVSTITVVDEHPAEVFRRLALGGDVMRFRSESGQAVLKTAGADGEVFDIDEPVAESKTAEYQSYKREDLAARHKDKYLQTALAEDKLTHALLRIQNHAEATIEEQGVNTLFLTLGMLHYRESDLSEQTYRAPLFLLPVVLERTSAKAAFEISSSGDEPLVNPALAEVLRRDFGISLPDIPPADEIGDQFDLQDLLSKVAAAILPKLGWKVTNEIYLGLFSFQKFVMYKDLEKHEAAVLGHRLVGRVVTKSGEAFDGLPDEMRQLSLDEAFPPESTAQVVDADSSQLRAIATIDRGHDLVMEGPPGTGKSQTITNIIAQALGRGKSVLFVAEKTAALEVVFDRLRAVGLSEFCLDLHSSKSQKKKFIEQLVLSLDSSLQSVKESDQARRRLPETRTGLSEYVQAVHAPFGAIQRTPYEGIGELEGRLSSSSFPLDFDPSQVSEEELARAARALADLTRMAVGVEPISNHPFRDSSRTYFSRDQLEGIRQVATHLRGAIVDLLDQSQLLELELGLPPSRSLEAIRGSGSIAGVFARSPGAPIEVLTSEAWNSPPAEARSLIARARSAQDRRAQVRKTLKAEALEIDPREDLQFLESKLTGRFAWLAPLSGRFRATRRKWRSLQTHADAVDLRPVVEAMLELVRLNEEISALRADQGRATALFGASWRGEESDTRALEEYVSWVVEFRAASLRHSLLRRGFEVASRGRPDVSAIGRQTQLVEQVATLRTQLEQYLQADGRIDALDSLEELGSRAAALESGSESGSSWAAFQSAAEEASGTRARGYVTAAMAGRLGFAELEPTFLRSFWQSWLEAAMQERHPIRRFQTLMHENRLKEFRELDRAVMEENRKALISRLRNSVQNDLQRPDVRQVMPVLRKEMARQRGHKPIRQVMKQAEPAIRAIKRCFMMSPMTVAQLLPGDAPTFDLVVFDEASQLPTEDAIGSVIRGRQLVVVGDPKQLPPTNFFSVASGQVETTRDEDGNPLFEDSESVLEEFSAAGVPRCRLKWHYRSTDESLIAFSNVSFYDSELITFPSVSRAGSENGLQFDFVPEGIYEGKGINRAEARRVVDAIAAHARARPTVSLGVGTFSMAQQYAILDLLEERRRTDADLDTFLAPKAQDGFFVKNLENIQGDERDIIFLSVTYAKSSDGRLRYQFGPLNLENGWRRLNVLVTRARKSLRVFSSVRSDDFHLEATESKGARLLRDYLAYAERRRLDLPIVGPGSVESPLELEVSRELSRRGVELIPQVGASGYRIDFGVVDARIPERFVCGIECDGASYHRSETARDRDRLRQQVLEARGWVIHRVWSTDWFKDRQGQIERLVRSIEATRDEAIRAADASKQARMPESQSAAGTPSAPQKAPLEQTVLPVARTYEVATGIKDWMRRDILEATSSEIETSILRVALIEAPIHIDDLVSRVASLWGSKAGSRISAKIELGIRDLKVRSKLMSRGLFVWNPEQKVIVRSREQLLNAQAERIAPEEYQAAVREVLRAGLTARGEVVTGVRTMLGFSRTGAKLEEQITAAIASMIASGVIGEGSRGLGLRTGS